MRLKKKDSKSLLYDLRDVFVDWKDNFRIARIFPYSIGKFFLINPFISRKYEIFTTTFLTL